MKWLLTAVKQGFKESWQLYWAPLNWYFDLYRGESWPHKLMTVLLTVWFIISLGFILSLFDK